MRSLAVTMPPGRPASPRFVVADVLRAAAIVFVLTSHTFYFASHRLVQLEVGTALGDWGVAAFFVLSGFLLGRPYVDAVLGRRRAPDPRAFAARRFFRIWPAYAIMVVANALISTLHHSKHAASVGEVVTHLLLIHTFFVQYLGGLDAPYWTLAVEAQFYVIMPLIANALIRLSPSKLQRRARFLRATIVGTIVVSLVWRIATALYIPLVDPNLTFVWYRNIIGMAMCFALGATVAIFESDGIVLSHRTAVTCTVGGLVLLGTMIPIGIFCRDVRLEKLAFDVLGSVSASAILLGSLHVRWDRFTKLAVPSFVSIIAAHSYALYLTHFPLLSLLRTGLTSLVHGGVRLELAIIGSFLLSAPLLAAAYRRFVEKPFLRVKQRIPEARPLGSDTANALVPSLSPF